MIFVDANVFMYAVGAPHPLRETAVEFLLNARRNNTPLATSAEVLQEMLHVYSSVGKFEALNEALTLVEAAGVEVWPLEKRGRDPRSPAARTSPHVECQRPVPHSVLPTPRSLRFDDLRRFAPRRVTINPLNLSARSVPTKQ